MKKIIFGLLSLIMILMLYKNDEFIVIPSNAIRIRVISNSNNIEDLSKKRVIKNDLEDYLYGLLGNIDNIEDARNVVKANVNNVEKIIENNGIIDYKVNYGLNYFPKKVYKGVLYQEGNYESIEVRLGNGVGDNYWCVLFPPLCLINENDNTSDVSYQLYVKELLEIDK